MDTQLIKYPRTPHLPWSPGATSDDKMLDDVTHFVGHEVVVTEKMDGENTTIYENGYTHARSLDSARHPSRSYVRSLAARVGPMLLQGHRICGENLFARHSLGYDRLPDFFLVFGIYNETMALSWDDTEYLTKEMGLHTVPVLYRGIWNEKAVKTCLSQSAFGQTPEGYVVRVTKSFLYEDFNSSVAKFVRPNHVTTDSHWMLEQVVPNSIG